jgi:hypothetical protein
VNNENAIRNGSLANNVKFFGSATSEIVSAAADSGSWNGDRIWSVESAQSWQMKSGYSYHTSAAGIFHNDNNNGGVLAGLGHRTILSGY